MLCFLHIYLVIWEEKWIDQCLSCATAQVLSVPGEIYEHVIFRSVDNVKAAWTEQSRAERSLPWGHGTAFAGLLSAKALVRAVLSSERIKWLISWASWTCCNIFIAVHMINKAHKKNSHVLYFTKEENLKLLDFSTLSGLPCCRAVSRNEKTWWGKEAEWDPYVPAPVLSL